MSRRFVARTWVSFGWVMAKVGRMARAVVYGAFCVVVLVILVLTESK